MGSSAAVRVSSAWGLWSRAWSAPGGCLVVCFEVQIRCPASLAAIECLTIFVSHLLVILKMYWPLYCTLLLVWQSPEIFISACLPSFSPRASCSPPRLLFSPLLLGRLRGVLLQQLVLTQQLAVAAPKLCPWSRGCEISSAASVQVNVVGPKGLN